MTLTIDKTEAEFLEVMEFALHVNTRDAHSQTAAIVDFLKRRLDLEFQEPEGRGEGVPEELEVRQDGDGKPYLHPRGVKSTADAQELREIAFKAVHRWGHFPGLLALARELESELAKWRGRLSFHDTELDESTYRLGVRARAFLGPLEGGRE